MIKKILHSNTSWSLISNGVTALLGFLNLALIAHQYSKDDAGKWFMLLTVYTLLEMLRSGWVQTPFVRYYVVAAGANERSKLTGASWQLLLMFTLGLSIITLPCNFISRFDEGAFSLAKRYIVLILFGTLPFQLLQWQLQARSSFKKLAVIKIFFSAAFSIALLLKDKFQFTIDAVVLLYIALQILSAVIGLILKWLQFGTWKHNLTAERHQLSNFGKYSMLTMVTASLLRSSDQFIIAVWLGPAAVAVYAIPQKLIEAIEIPVRSFASVAMPNATSLHQSGNLAHLRQFFYRQCGLLTTLILPLVVLLFVFPSPIINLLGGSKYHESSALLQIFCFYAVLIPIDRYCGLLLDAGNRPKMNALKVLVMLVINVLLDLAALWMGLDLYGVAAGSTITFLLGVVIGWVQLKDILKGFSAITFWNEGLVRSLKSNPTA